VAETDHTESEHGISRNETDDGWYVKAVKKSTAPKPFFDVAYGGSAGASYLAARDYNLKLRPYKGTLRNYTVARCDKSHPELPVGITLSVLDRLNRGGKGTTKVYSFSVSMLNGKSTTVYIGTANTWQTNYAAALEKAIGVREKCRAAHRKEPFQPTAGIPA